MGLNATGWYVEWDDGRREVVVTFVPGGPGNSDTELQPMVVNEEQTHIVPASDRGPYHLVNPQLYTRGH